MVSWDHGASLLKIPFHRDMAYFSLISGEDKNI